MRSRLQQETLLQYYINWLKHLVSSYKKQCFEAPMIEIIDSKHVRHLLKAILIPCANQKWP